MHLRSIAVPTWSPLSNKYYDLFRISSDNYLQHLNWKQVNELHCDFQRLPRRVQRRVLLYLVQEYHAVFQARIKCYRTALRELSLRIIFEILKGIIRINNVRQDIWSSGRRDMNHQTRMKILISRCRQMRKQIPNVKMAQWLDELV